MDHLSSIFIGHAWLHDGNANEIDPWPNSDLSKIKIRKFFFLNKEYANLNKKLRWIKNNNISCVFSHHQKCKKWQDKVKELDLSFCPLDMMKVIFFIYKKKKI